MRKSLESYSSGEGKRIFVASQGRNNVKVLRCQLWEVGKTFRKDICRIFMFF